MPNRKTFDERDKYDHIGHSTAKAEKGDLASTPDANPQRGPQLPRPADDSIRGRSRRAGRDRIAD
jgi:hypothetical protein